MEIVGELSEAGDAYRGGLRRIGPGGGTLLLLGGERSMNGRLVTAAAVELVAAAALIGSALVLIVYGASVWARLP